MFLGSRSKVFDESKKSLFLRVKYQFFTQFVIAPSSSVGLRLMADKGEDSDPDIYGSSLYLFMMVSGMQFRIATGAPPSQ